MGIAVVRSRALSGIRAPEVVVEAHLANGLPGFTLVGLPETEVKEARDRVRAAIQNSRFDFPASRITVNLAPADLPKESGRYDLPIALGILAASGQIPLVSLEGYEFVGELALTGALRSVQGALAMAIGVRDAGRGFVLPQVNAEEAALITDSRVYPATSLLDVCAHLTGRHTIAPHQTASAPASAESWPDFHEVRGQAMTKRALEIAAVGGHSLLMVGPPGTGKSMLASRMPGILPDMDEQEATESAALLSLVGRFDARSWRKRPWRAPHHTASAVALVGGGSQPRPGEISLAHHGVLFLDELPEFPRAVLEVLRQPLETGAIHISRAARQVEFPARFQLLAAMNPCPCGYFGHPSGQCRCTPDQIARYRGRLSGPLLDRIDLQVEVPALSIDNLQQAADGEYSNIIRARVVQARERQMSRQGMPNAWLGSAQIDEHAMLAEKAVALLKQAMQKLNLSARAYHRIIKVARSIADLANSEVIQAGHMAEAIQYRRLSN